MSRPVLPGATVGVLGGGQLGRMFAIAARRMGYRVHTYSPDDDTPTGQVSDREIKASYEDEDALAAFAREVGVVTFEFENIPAGAVEVAARYAPVRPSGNVLYTAQDRLREKNFLSQAGFPVAAFAEVRTQEQLTAGLARIGAPAVLKTAGWGYDGKGQRRVSSVDEASAAWRELGAAPAVLEEFVKFECEVSVVAARGIDGSMADYGVVENRHERHILDVSTAPAPLAEPLAREAVEIARGILQALDVVGVMCVEFFVTGDARLVVNELAPRPHNSGHFTIDACQTSQFEQQLRAVCGLPLGSAEFIRPAAMANLLGDLWEKGVPDWPAALAMPNVRLHLYGKESPRLGRKMGHLTALADTADEARAVVLAARRALCPALKE